MPARIPDYEKYSLVELYQVLNSISVDLVPHVYDALVEEIDSREHSSLAELEDCWFALDRARNPEFADRLAERIIALGGGALAQPAPVPEEMRYRTFWRRFWALFLDGFVVGIPLILVLVFLDRANIVPARFMPYVEQFMTLVALAYYIVLHARFGQTVGKMATGVIVIDKAEESGITWRQAVLRDVVPVFFFFVSFAYLLYSGTRIDEAIETEPSSILLNAYAFATGAWSVAEVITMLFNKKRRAVHDFIAGTVVVRL